ncbi:hypothetical protein [Polycladospora coralii]|nr:hypothetical protein [Polycladospora coralii]
MNAMYEESHEKYCEHCGTELRETDNTQTETDMVHEFLLKCYE